jgi:hypothetical protein
MNRDEKRTRPKGLAPVQRNVDGRLVVYPSEPGGGTWVALNDHGASLALINWYSVKAKPRGNIVSRGEIIPAISNASNSAITDAGLTLLPLHHINPFRLIGVFPGSWEITEWCWDLKQLLRKSHPWRPRQWISSGFDEPTAQQVRGTTFKHAQTQETAGTIDWLRRLHRSHSPEKGPFSTCMHRDDAATVSYTELDVSGANLSMRHVSGPPCGRADSHSGFIASSKC